jgi:hypothetical protein
MRSEQTNHGGLKHYLFEAVWYSPNSYELYHYAVIDVDAYSLREAKDRAYDVLRKHNRPLRMGVQPVTLKLIGPVHHWGAGYKPGRDPILREGEKNMENPLSPTMKGVLVLAALGGVAAAIYYATQSSAAATTPSSGRLASTLQLMAGPMSATVPVGGMTLTLPAGGTWDSSMPAPYAGTSTPIPLAYSAGQSQTQTYNWTANGTDNTTTLSITN